MSLNTQTKKKKKKHTPTSIINNNTKSLVSREPANSLRYIYNKEKDKKEYTLIYSLKKKTKYIYI